jgi:germination protein YpeB
MKIRKKNILLASYILAGFAVLGAFANNYHLESEAYKLQLENNYHHALTELVSGIGELDSALQKTLYATTPSMVSSVCTEVYGKAQSAQYALGELPFSAFKFQKMSGFVTKVGDYAYMLSKKAGLGAAATEEEHQNLQKLSDTASILSGNLNQMLLDARSAGVRLGRVNDMTNQVSQIGEAATSNILQESFTLIYDGPFSSQISGLKPRMLEGQQEITAEDALKKAASFMGLKAGDVKPNGERAGNLPVYMFYANSDGGTVSFEVTKKGGFITDVFNSRLIKTRVLSPADASKLAARFLDKKGYKNMKQSYEMTNDNSCTVNFAYTEGGAICYTDLIKVTVALDNGSIVGFESQGFVMNHTARAIPAAKISEAQAKTKVSTFLKVLSHEMAVIPTAGKNEVFCHEFKCENDNGNHYIIYVNALTGNEEKILILQETPEGTLAI